MTAATPPTADAGAEHDFDAFGEVNAWVFDLDNTLYPRNIDIFGQVDRRIKEYLRIFLAIDHDEVHRVQKHYRQRYGTTLRGLMAEHDAHPDAFLEYVHDIDHSVIAPAPRLTDAIARLPGRKFILTNGSRRHAEAVAAKLGFTDHFEDIFDIVRADLLPKPERRTYEGFVAATGIAPQSAAMFEDLPCNLEVPKALGMRTVLIVPGSQVIDDADHDIEGHDADHIDHRTEDLGGFLEELLRVIDAP
jgi:putative hydrolase of the HAD superfamily